MSAGVLALVCSLLGCSSSSDDKQQPEPAPTNYVERRDNVVVQHIGERRDPETGAITSHAPDEPPPPNKKIETQRMNLGGGPKVEREKMGEEEDVPLAKFVEVHTWADDVIRGVLVEEKPDAYIIDVTTDDAAKTRVTRKVARAAVMSIKVIPRPRPQGQ